MKNIYDRQYLSLEIEEWHIQDRINFLVNKFPILSRARTKLPLGQYLKAANLLSDYQIETILREQKQYGLCFGEMAIYKGYLKPITVDFFLELSWL